MAFLALTADQRYWKTDEPIVFLGEWCREYQSRDVWSSLDCKVLPYHWENREKLYLDIDIIESIYEKYLLQLALSLNSIHKKTYSVYYWRIVIGVWLRNFIDVCYDRYLSITTAIDSKEITYTYLSDTKPRYPKKPVSFAWDDYNQYLFSRIIKKMECFPYEEKHFTSGSIELKRPLAVKPSYIKKMFVELKRQCSKGWKTILRQGFAVAVIECYPRIVGKLSAEIVFVGSIYLSLINQIKLQLSLKQIPYLFHGKKNYISGTRPNLEMRKSLKLPKPKNQFEEILNTLLPDEMPMSYLEDYEAMRKKSLAISPKTPKAILTAFSINYRDVSDLWMAHHAENSQTKLLLSQHGGGYGIAKQLSLDQHFLAVFDRYYTWGSKINGTEQVSPMPSLRLSRMKSRLSKRKYKKNGQILMMATTMPRYKIFVESGIAGPHMLNYFNDQKHFLEKLTLNAFDLIVWRYFNDKHWDDKNRMLDMFPSLKTQFGLKKQLGKDSDFIDQISQSRLAIHTANETTYLETLAANFPTIVFWNPKYYETREELLPYFEALIKAGILHLEPESAATKVNAIYEDPMDWWLSKPVQDARGFFCEHVALTDDNFLSKWTVELKKQVIEKKVEEK